MDKQHGVLPIGVGGIFSMTRPAAASPAFPSTLNLGSGKDFRDDAFNIDIDDTWGPDAVLDLSSVDLATQAITLETQRFGQVTLGPDSFERIIANDVLEHVPNLMGLMTTCLALLRMDGRFEISVPYDLSFGAWQDPTHVRAFNERSWLYYTDWFWYMGWDRTRFALDDLKFVPSPAGEALQRQGAAIDTILTTPRAIDSMSAVLRKVALSAADRQTWDHWRERRRMAQSRKGARPPAAVLPEQDVPVPARPAAAAPEPFSGPWSSHRDRYCIWIVSPKGYDHHQAFDEIALGLAAAFAERGGSAPVVSHPSGWAGRTPIVLGAHLLSPNLALILPPESIIFNFEQVDRTSTWLTEQYLDLLRRHRVLDYSHHNLAVLHAMGIGHARLLQPGYAPALSRIAPAPVQDIDVLFYGSTNERRIAVLNELRSQGVAVTHLFNVYGAERDAAIARAKIVLNIHFYEAAVFESARVGFLLANAACVVSEGRLDDPDLAPFRGGLAVCEYGSIVPLCLALLADEPLRRALARQGLANAQKRSQAELLGALFPEMRDAA